MFCTVKIGEKEQMGYELTVPIYSVCNVDICFADCYI